MTMLKILRDENSNAIFNQADQRFSIEAFAFSLFVFPRPIVSENWIFHLETIPVVLDDGCSPTDKFPSLPALSANQTPDWTINSVSTAFNELSLLLLLWFFFLHCSKRTPVAATSWLIAPTKPHTVLGTHPNPHTPTHTWGKSERQPEPRQDGRQGRLLWPVDSFISWFTWPPARCAGGASFCCLFVCIVLPCCAGYWLVFTPPILPHGLTGCLLRILAQPLGWDRTLTHCCVLSYCGIHRKSPDKFTLTCYRTRIPSLSVPYLYLSLPFSLSIVVFVCTHSVLVSVLPAESFHKLI